MNTLKETIARNMIRLRTAAHYTQAEVANKLSYSDKAVSKWERAESIPDITVLKAIADMYGVTVDYLLTESEDAEPPVKAQERPVRMTHNQIIITLISVLGVWLVAAVIFFIFILCGDVYWQIFVYTVPISVTVAVVLSCVWGSIWLRFFYISLLVWTLAASIYIALQMNYMWLIFVLTALAQILTILAFRIKRHER